MHNILRYQIWKKILCDVLEEEGGGKTKGHMKIFVTKSIYKWPLSSIVNVSWTDQVIFINNFIWIIDSVLFSHWSNFFQYHINLLLFRSINYRAYCCNIFFSLSRCWIHFVCSLSLLFNSMVNLLKYKSYKSFKLLF